MPDRGKIARRKRRRGGDDVAAKADCRCLFQRQQMGADHIADVDAAVKKLVGLGILRRISVSNGGIVVVFGKETRRPENDHRQAGFAGKEFAQAFGGEFRYAVDVFCDGTHVLSHPWQGA